MLKLAWTSEFPAIKRTFLLRTEPDISTSRRQIAFASTSYQTSVISTIIGAYLVAARVLVRSDRIDGRARATADGHWCRSQQKFPALAFCRFLAELLQVAVIEDVDAHGHQNKLVNR